MTARKKLIEVALPLEAINDASAREKYISSGHPSTLHLWWARRPLAAVRAVVFSSLVDDPDNPNAPTEFVEECKQLPRGRNAAENDTPRQRLFDFIELLVQWESATDERILETARRLIRLSNGDNLPLVIDPFAGGGSIPLEAQRLGLEAQARDLNPVAVLINKAMIEIPPLFGNLPPVNPGSETSTARGGDWQYASGLADDIRYYAALMRQLAFDQIGEYYPPGPNDETIIAWLWARTVKCPSPACRAKIPMTSTFWLSKKKSNRAWVEPEIDKQEREINFGVKNDPNGEAPDPPKAGRGANFRCLICGEIAHEDYIRSESMAGRMTAQLMAIAAEGANGRSYYAPTEAQIETAENIDVGWRPDGELPDNPRWFSPPLFGMPEYADLFTPRQILALKTFSDLVPEIRELVYQDAIRAGLRDDGISLDEGGNGARAYAEAISVYLGMNVSRQANRLSSICFWDNYGEKVQQVFARQAIPMTWDYAEANPFSNSSGNFLGQLDYLARVLEKLVWVKQGKAKQADAATTRYTGEPDRVFATDPPYYDNIGYADLSDYFYIWLRQSLKHLYPGLFATLLVPKASELVATPDRFDGDKDAATAHFERGLTRSFVNMAKVANPSFPLTTFYAFRQSEVVTDSEGNGTAVSSTGWEKMLEGLIQAGFSVGGTWPMRTEATKNLKKNINALASSIVLVCRPRPDDAPITSRREFVNTLRQELPAALREMQSGNIAPVDLAQASIGPGMAVYSRYSKVLEPNGDRLTVRTALQLINHELDAYLAEQEGYIDADSRFAVAWFEQFGFNEAPFGQADVLARAKNTSVEGLVSAGVLESGAGKVRLLQWEELDPGWDPTTDKRTTTWEATHHLIERLNTYGEEGAAQLLAKMPSDLAAEARQLAYRLYSICERKGWADHARDYNALVISWSASQEQARQFKEQHQQSSFGWDTD